jgi:uncharacterized repeat protein (TIGR03803 family)
LIVDSAGNLYGATFQTGGAGAGLAYKLDTSGNFTVLLKFTGGADGGFPQVCVLDPTGELYGTALSGGANGGGLVFKLDLP